MFDDPLQFYSRSTTLGIVVALMLVIGAGLLAYLNPKGNLGDATLVADRSTNQLYVILSGQLHPVYNLTSARLVLGNPANPMAVASADLNGMPKGQTIGIPGAPYATPVSSETSSVWALCDTVTAAASDAPALETVVVSMPLVPDAAIDPIRSDEAVLVSHQGKVWVVTPEGRHALDLGDRALTSAVGIAETAKPIPISEALFNALPDGGAWQLPPMPAQGAPNSLGLPDDLVIGSVFQIYTERGPQNFVVLPDGIARVSPTTADALRDVESHGLLEPPMVESSLVVKFPEQVYASPLPDEPLKLTSATEEPTLCWTWEHTPADQSPKITVLTGRHLPIPPSAMAAGIKQIQGTATVFTNSGKYVTLQSPDPRHGEAAYYIDPQGVRYGIPNEETANALGLNSPKTAPWEVVRFLVEGPVLSKDAALLEHDTLPADPSPRRFPAEPPGTR